MTRRRVETDGRSNGSSSARAKRERRRRTRASARDYLAEVRDVRAVDAIAVRLLRLDAVLVAVFPDLESKARATVRAAAAKVLEIERLRSELLSQLAEADARERERMEA